MGSCAAPSAKGDDKFITTDYLQQCRGAKLTASLAQAGEKLIVNSEAAINKRRFNSMSSGKGEITVLFTEVLSNKHG
ncbi:hypothetical protein GQK89_21175 [Escherichia coli]|nr:hypothetical protein [Escherichia coli]